MRAFLPLMIICVMTVEAQAVGEVLGGSKRLAVERETLNIDFRPLLNKDPRARIEVIYKLVNSGASLEQQLFLAARDAVVELDGLPVTIRPASLELPLDFRPPDTTPALALQPPIYYSPAVAKEGLSFTITVPTGEHLLRLLYSAPAQERSFSSPSLFWQFGYILAPGKEWASHGGLDLYVYLPPNWEGACNLPIQRGKDMLVGSWNSLPRDNIALTLRQIPPQLLRYSYAAAASGLLLSIFGTLLLGHLGYLRGRAKSLLSLILVTSLSTTVFATSYILDLEALRRALGAQLSNAYSSRLYSAITIAALCSLFVCSITVWSTRLKRALNSSSNT